MMMLGHCLLVPWSQQSRCLFPERDVNDSSRKPCRVAVPCVKYWRISIRMQEKGPVAGRENALFEGKELYMSRHFLSQPCRSREDDQKASTVHEKWSDSSHLLFLAGLSCFTQCHGEWGVNLGLRKESRTYTRVRCYLCLERSCFSQAPETCVTGGTSQKWNCQYHQLWS